MKPLPPSSILQNAFVRLEPLSRTHVPALLAAATQGPRDTFRLTQVPDTEPAMRSYVETALAQRADGSAVAFATISQATGAVVGSTRLGALEYWSWPQGAPSSRPPGVPDAAEIGWTWLAAAAQRTALNTAAKLLMLGHAFETWQVHRVTLKTDARNERSRRAIERVGGHLDGVLRAHMPAYDGGIRDTAYYSVLASEWPEVKAALSRRLTHA